MASLILIGAGPGIGAAVTRLCVDTGDPVGLLARSSISIEPIEQSLRARGNRVATRTADVADEAELTSAVAGLVAELGVPQLLVYNAGLIRADKPGELGYAEHMRAYAINVLGAMHVVTQLAPAMASAGGGTVIITGGMPRPEASHVSLSLGKVGVRALTAMLAQTYGPRGVHVATVTVCGAVAQGGRFDPDEIAATYRGLHEQPMDQWEHEIMYTGRPTVIRGAHEVTG
jgi:NADP-dependent 3-hydroxy acid dehydrogenase YdfG